MTLDEIRQRLCDVPLIYESMDSAQITEVLTAVKIAAVDRNDQHAAKEAWCLKEAFHAQNKYVEAWFAMRSGCYYPAWCSLEQSELAIGRLRPHLHMESDAFHIDFIARHVSQYQTLYPYKLFLSPEMVAGGKLCSICNKPVSLRSPCGHTVGEIYDGEYCARLVTKPVFLGISIVRNPVQKYSVVFISDPKTGQRTDQYDYSAVKWVIDRLASPFHGWTPHWTKTRHPHSIYKAIGRNDECPCESGKKYKRCCLHESGVLRPHCQIDFEVPPSHGLGGEIEYF